ICYGSGSWCLSTWKVSLVMLRAVETFWEIFRICKTPGFLQHSWRLSIGDSYSILMKAHYRTFQSYVCKMYPSGCSWGRISHIASHLGEKGWQIRRHCSHHVGFAPDMPVMW